MELTSSAFSNGDRIDSRFTCDGTNLSPALSWRNVPAGTKSLALVCDDPDAPMGSWIHWVYFDIPPGIDGLEENVPPVDHPEAGGTQGLNDFRRKGYGGPCPPGGTHRYFFKLYALDRKTGLPPGTDRRKLLHAMDGHILGSAELVGRYGR